MCGAKDTERCRCGCDAGPELHHDARAAVDIDPGTLSRGQLIGSGQAGDVFAGGGLKITAADIVQPAARIVQLPRDDEIVRRRRPGGTGDFKTDPSIQSGSWKLQEQGQGSSHDDIVGLKRDGIWHL